MSWLFVSADEDSRYGCNLGPALPGLLASGGTMSIMIYPAFQQLPCFLKLQSCHSSFIAFCMYTVFFVIDVASLKDTDSIGRARHAARQVQRRTRKEE